MDKPMTVREVIEVTIRELSRVMIPANMVREIGVPVSNAIHNLEMCRDAIDREMAQAAPAADEPVIELFGGPELVGTEPAEENGNE